MDETLFDPVQIYDSLKEKHKKNSEDYFDKMVKVAKVDVEANRTTVKNYKLALAKIVKFKKKRTSLKTWRVFFYIFSGIAFLLAIMFLLFAILLNKSIPLVVSLCLMGGFALIGAAFIVLALKWLTPRIHNWNSILADLQSQADALLAEANAQMLPLNERYDWNMQTYLVKETTPLISLDNTFDPVKQDMFLHRFRYEENNLDTSSVYFAQSGTIRGNPFIMERDDFSSMIDWTYSGSITIHWTTRTKKSDGTVVDESHEQTLSASVTRPKPVYSHATYLFYGNDSAPNLSFKRSPTKLHLPTDDEVKKYVKKTIKKVKEQGNKSLMKDSSNIFTAMGNETFDALFYTPDRNNQVEYRLLFTPLAQKGMINLIKKDPYGDDFFFQKSGVLNMIKSDHFQEADIYSNPKSFYNYDIDAAKINFVNYMDSYFQNFFFALAPILSIPEYELNKPTGFVETPSECNYTDTEEEIMSHSLPREILIPTNCITELILKNDFKEKKGILDISEITSHGYGANRYTKTFILDGGDGKRHNVPVNYLEYFPVTRVNKLVVTKIPFDRYGFNHDFFDTKAGAWVKSKAISLECIIYQRGLLAFIPKNPISDEEAKEFESCLYGSPDEKGKTSL